MDKKNKNVQLIEEKDEEKPQQKPHWFEANGGIILGSAFLIILAFLFFSISQTDSNNKEDNQKPKQVDTKSKNIEKGNAKGLVHDISSLTGLSPEVTKNGFYLGISIIGGSAGLRWLLKKRGWGVLKGTQSKISSELNPTK